MKLSMIPLPTTKSMYHSLDFSPGACERLLKSFLQTWGDAPHFSNLLGVDDLFWTAVSCSALWM